MIDKAKPRTCIVETILGKVDLTHDNNKLVPDHH